MKLSKKVKPPTAQEKIEIEEQKNRIIANQNFCCYYCGEPLTSKADSQMSHIIPKWKSMIEKYGAEVIHHPLNTPVCHSKCNSKVMIHPSHTEAIKQHLKPIYEDLRTKGYDID